MNRPMIDDEDNQRVRNDAAVADLIECEHFPKFNCSTWLGRHVLRNNLSYSQDRPATRWIFFYRLHQHTHGILYIQLPRDMDAIHNPDQQLIHIVTMKFPAQSITGHVQCLAIDGSNIPTGFNAPEAIENIHHYLIKLEALDCVVSGGNLPKLIDDTLHEQM